MIQLLSKYSTALFSLCCGLLVCLFLNISSKEVGYTRDEGIYFHASRQSASWFEQFIESPSQATNRKSINKSFASNREHPPTMKMLAGISAKALSKPEGIWPVMSEGQAMRFPAHVLAGFGVFLLLMLGRQLGRHLAFGLLAAGAFISLPRVVFHATLHCFDLPITVATLFVAWVYLKSLRSFAWALAVGPALGLAISIKHNALFLLPLLGLHYLLITFVPSHTRRWSTIRKRLFSAPLWSLAFLTPLTSLALWPWLWPDPIGRFADYLQFHRQHSYYNMEFLGQNFGEPPLPTAYPWLMTWATVPSCLLLLALIGGAFALHSSFRDAARSNFVGASEDKQLPKISWKLPFPNATFVYEELLLVLLALFPLCLIALPTIPIFGGTKHWMTAYPFLALLIALATGKLWVALQAHLQKLSSLVRIQNALPWLVTCLLLVPSSWATLSGHPYNLSQYAPLVGGARGAAELGLNRGFWGTALVPLVDIHSGQTASPKTRVYLHDLHRLALEQYQREGRATNWVPSSVKQAKLALYFDELHMRWYELQIWNEMHSTVPDQMITLHDVPLTRFYRKEVPE